MTHSGAPSLQSFPTLAGYTLTEQLYASSRTAVYRAIQTATQQPVVIKVLLHEYPSFSELAQFRNQYAITKNLPIPGIIHPLSLEPLGSSYALVMEDWDGIALNTYLQQQPLNLAEVLSIALQLCDILHDLGQHRVVHKDIKPANILIQPESKQVKLIDFSIASLLPKETQEIQCASTLEGTLAYLAPEQTGRMNRGIDYRTDFYALGVTLYELLSGKLPFDSEDPLELMHCHMAKVPPSVDAVNPEVPAMVAAIVHKLMAKNAEDRYQSALGLKHDLEQCLSQWKETGKVPEFQLGQRDLSDRFLIPEKLYGREQEVQTLLQAFERVANGSSELMLVAGFSGIGKTAVINEVHKPIVKQRGYFIKGKFDQFNRDIPLSAFVQALRDLIRQLLSESDEQLAQWRAKILTAVGEIGRVLIEVIPELEQIIGQQPPVPELTGSAAQNRFNRLFQKFIEVFTTAEHPLVIFLDDLQWADLASLQLLNLLMSDNGYLLLLGAYRDNEVSPTHPFIMTVAELKKAGNLVNTITLLPLAFDDTNHLVADTLNCSMELAQPLTEFINRKTQGNPFFTTQFLKALHEDGDIHFNYDRRYWECDIVQVNARSLTDDVVEFMALQLQKLPEATQQVLKLAACIGNQFDLNTLAIISEQSLADTATALWSALQEGLILPTSQVYKFFQSSGQCDLDGSTNPTYRFVHDRVQQAAYSLIPEVHRTEIHYRIGRLLLSYFSSAAQEERIFEIVSHLNSGSKLIINPSEQLDLAQWNAIAARKAVSSNAYEAALEYLNLAIDLLPENAWTDHYTFTLELHHHRLDVAYLTAQFEALEVWGNILSKRAHSLLDQIKVYETRIMALRSQGRFLEAVETGLQVLRLFGVEFPAQPTPTDIRTAYEQSRQLWQGYDPLRLLDRPTMKDPQIIAAMQIISKIVSSAHIAVPALFPLLVFKQVELSIQHGNSPISIFSYAEYGMILCNTIGDISTGGQFGQLALALLEKLQATSFKSRAYFIVNAFIHHWQKPLLHSIPLFLEGYRSGLENGDWECVALHLLTVSRYQYWAGKELQELSEDMLTYQQAIDQVKQEATLKSQEIYLQAVFNLLGQAEIPYCLQGHVFRADQSLPILQAHNDRGSLCHFYLNQAFLCYLFNQDEQAAQNIADVEEYADGVFGFLEMIIWVFYDALIKIRCYSSAHAEQQKLILKRVAEHQAKLQTWATQAPFNHQHRWQLIAAEYHRILNQREDASDLYDQAIATAKQNGFIQEEALANELTAKFYLDWGKEEIAQNYLINAYYSYARWGANAKVQDLEQRYSRLLMPVLQPQCLLVSAAETIFDAPSLTQPSSGTHPSSYGNTGSSASLDLTTILKASQSLSREIQLDKLLATLLHTVLENAGADKGALLLPRDNQWFVEATAAIHQPAQIQSIPLSDSSEVSHCLINLVKRSQESVVIVDASSHPTLAMDSYVVEHQIKSLLCTPILQLGKLVAILYLENRVTAGAFTSDRVELLNLLCTQAAISLENARLYQQVQTYAQQLERSQLQIVQSEKMASLGNLVAGVAHEINNPIGFLNGSINNAKEYVQDLLEHLALYQKHYPNPVAEIQDNAEDLDLDFLREDLPKLLDSMQGATDRIKNISTSLRTFSRADTEHKVKANLHEGIESALLILKYRLKANELRPAIEIVKEYGNLPEIDCFPGQLNQVFMNILANAIDMFDEMAQTQSFDQIEAHPQQITIRTTADANQVQIQIGDNGKGMTEAVQAKIFDHLFTTKAVGKGTGLGLAIARQIVVEKHGGSLEVQSALGQGTEFCIRLPIVG